MGRFKALILAAAAACPILAGTSTTAGDYVRAAAFFAAGSYAEEDNPADNTSAPENAERVENAESLSSLESSDVTIECSSEDDAEQPSQSAESLSPNETLSPSNSFSNSETLSTSEPLSSSDSISPSETLSPNESLSPAESGAGEIITQGGESVSEDLSGYNNNSGKIIRESYGYSYGTDHITLASGAQVRNMTDKSAEELLEAADELPLMRVNLKSSEPLVLIVHTHTTEDYEPTARDFYDENFPTRSRDCSQNVCAVGNELAQKLSEYGISVVHDCTVHDYPAYTGAYDRSEETIKKALEMYPSIKIVIDLHRDATENAQGQRIAPCAQINGESAAQFMIIAGCDNGLFNMPDYMENFKLACLIQNTSQELYAGLARPVLFDYRNYNQHLTTGSLLIEVGSHANSLDEAKYTGRLLGDILARTLEKIEE